MVRLGLDLAWGKLSEHEVDRARELREIVTSLGPAYIKLGQALSIRPDILSPAAMYEMQKLCDKVCPICHCISLSCLCSVHLSGPAQYLTWQTHSSQQFCPHRNCKCTTLRVYPLSTVCKLSHPSAKYWHVQKHDLQC